MAVLARVIQDRYLRAVDLTVLLIGHCCIVTMMNYKVQDANQPTKLSKALGPAIYRAVIELEYPWESLIALNV